MKKKKHASRRGALPGKIVHVGERRHGDVLLTWVHLDGEQPVLKISDMNESIRMIKAGLGDNGKEASVKWLIVEGLHDIGILNGIMKALGLESIIGEKIANTYERPGLRRYGSHEVATMRYVFSGMSGEEPFALESEQVTLIRRGNVIVSFFEDGLQSMPGLLTRLSEIDPRVATLGAPYLFYSLMDAVLDGYYMVMEQMADRMETLETAIVNKPDKSHLTELQLQRKQLSEIHRYLWPLKDALSTYVMLDRIADGQSLLTTCYMELHEESTHLEEMVAHDREALSELLELYLSSANKHQSDTMQFLALVSTVYMPLTFIVGIYGMNFKHMPELSQRWAYPMVLVVLLVIAVGHYIWFKRKRWL